MKKEFLHFSIRTIRNKLIFVLSLSIFLTCLVISSALLLIRRNVRKDIEAMATDTLELYMKKLDLQLVDFIKFAAALTTSDEIQTPLKLLDGPASPYEKLLAGSALEDSLYIQQTMLEALSGIIIVSNAEELYASSPHIKNCQVWQIDEITAAAQGTKGELHWERIRHGEDHYLAFYRIINTVGNNFTYLPLGTLIFYINMDKLADRAFFQDAGGKDFILISDAHDQPLYCSSPIGEEALGDVASDYVRTLADTHLVSHRTSQESGWNYYLLLSNQVVYGKIDATIRTVLYICMALTIFVCAICYRISRNISLPLGRLTQELRQVGEGDFHIDEAYLLEAAKEDEIGDICRNFISTVHRLELLINENYLASLHYKDAQLKALQAQINPHFLYNALNSISWLAKLGDVEKIPRLVSALSALMRSTMDHSSVSGTLSEELQLVSHYITIQQIRFGSRLHYEQECPAALYDARIPRLLLQPLVENAVKYALEPSEDSCSIRIQVTCSETNLQITVADNGPGIPTARLTAIRQDQAAPSGSGIGLRNLKERLLLLYGAAASFSIDSRPGHGTTITLDMPYEGGTP